MLGEEYVVIILFCCLAWCGNKEFAHKTGFAFCLGMGVNQILKLIFCVQRPWVLDERIKPKESALEKATGYSFPSGHTQSGVTAFGCLAVKSRKWILRILCVVFALMIGFSRMYLGVHTIYDVATSLLIGAVVICVTESIYRLCVKHDVLTMLFGVAVSIFMVAFAVFKEYPSYHMPEYAFDCVKIAGAIGGFFIGWFAEKRLVNYAPSGKTASNILKVSVGVVVLLVLKVLFKVAFVQTHFIMYIQNFVLIFWCIFVYPWILKRLVKEKV
jgi:undecaprenyl-diphosphatase